MIAPASRSTPTPPKTTFAPSFGGKAGVPLDKTVLDFDGAAHGVDHAAEFDQAEIMAEIVAKRLVEHLERAGFVIMKRPPIGGGAALGRGFEG